MSVYDELGAAYDDYRGPVGVADVLDALADRPQPWRVLDLGCGTGRPIALAVALRCGRYVGIDASEPMLAAFRQRLPQVEALQLDMSAIGGLDGPFDLVFSYGALCHLQPVEQEATLRAIPSLLAPAGKLLFTGGEQAGSCSGAVGEYETKHYSLGRESYVDLLAEFDVHLLTAGPMERGNFTYLFQAASGGQSQR